MAEPIIVSEIMIKWDPNDTEAEKDKAYEDTVKRIKESGGHITREAPEEAIWVEIVGRTFTVEHNSPPRGCEYKGIPVQEAAGEEWLYKNGKRYSVSK